jgi:hypothetical protein
MLRKAIAGAIFASGLVGLAAHSQLFDEPAQDEAKVAGLKAADLPSASEDYFADMDYGYRRDSDPSVKLNAAEIRGRNTWNVWTGGNDRFWDHMANNTFGAFDLLKIVSSYPATGYCTEQADREHYNRYTGNSAGPKTEQDCRSQGKTWVAVGRDVRWRYYGIVNEPCFDKASEGDKERWGLWLDKRVATSADCPADPYENESKYPGVKRDARGSKNVPVGSYYGKASGVAGLRLFPNPDFNEAAQAKWDPVKYYTDPSYYNDQHLVRPYRVGMSCGFCHIGPNPVNPPADPEHPKWANLNSNPGAQYFWVDRVFMWNPQSESNFIFQLLHSSLPGTLDTSFISSDNINNPRTMNAIYNVQGRLEAAKRWKEKLAGGGLNNRQFNEFEQTKVLSDLFVPPDTVFTPHVLKDGADSVGIPGALNRVFINIGLYSEEWLKHFRPLVGGKTVSPLRISDAEKNSVYWQATAQQTPDLALFFLKSARPDRLKDAPGGQTYLTADQNKLNQGKAVFAENCARCHSSKQPPNLCAAGQPCTSGQILENSAEYFRWMRNTVTSADFLDNNFLSTDRRVPMTELGINACSPLASNGIRDNIWDNFTSETYKQLPAVGPITVYNPIDGTPSEFQPPGGGRGYVRVTSLVSLWSSAPYLQNNSVGSFNGDPSVEGRMRAFDDGIHQMLWPDRRAKDPLLGNKIPGPSLILRTTASSYLRVPSGYLPDALKDVGAGGLLNRLAPFAFDRQGDLEIGPIPKGTPVSLLPNMGLLPDGTGIEDKVEHGKKLIALLIKFKKDLKSLPANATDDDARKAFSNAVPDMLELSKCPDFIVNKGHYFGSNLSDDDKNALIEFLKTF